MQRIESKQSQQSPKPPNALSTFFSNYSNYIHQSQNIDLDLQKLMNEYNHQLNQFNLPPTFPLLKQDIELSKQQVKVLGAKMKNLGEEKLIQTVTNIQKLNSKLTADYLMELNYAVELGLLQKFKTGDTQ